ncbi:MAG: tetratricopeptide repeat protein, partial [Acidimicrobiia bacterium]|nr:tetratricopeptide repeat protein [Acidimicrobiia bacterium]
VLEADAAHEEAAIALASIMLEAGDTESALAVLEPVPSSAGVDRFRAVVRLATEPGAPTTDLEAAVESAPDNEALRIELARALIAGQDYAGALDHLLEVVSRKGELLDDARTVMLDVFEVLGADSPITQDYRRRLANALF